MDSQRYLARKLQGILRRLLLFLLLPIAAFPQAWSSFLDPTRAIDWNASSGAGFTIPNYVINCSVQPSLLAGQANSAANATSLANSIASCDATHNVVNIPAGTWYYDSMFIRKSSVVIRGAGPNNTTIIPVNGTNCVGGITHGICILSNGNIFAGSGSVTPPSGTQQCAWTGGYAQGSTSTITINACGGTAPPVNTIIDMDQLNDTTDNGGVYICDDSTSGCTVEPVGGGNNNGRRSGSVTRSQQQLTKVTALTNNGGGNFTLTISPGVYFTNIRSGQSPGIWWGQTIQNVGVENITIDGSLMSSGTPTNHGNIGIQQCYQCWVKGIRSINAGRNHIELGITFQDTIRDSYFFASASGSSQSYTIETEEVSGILAENNIMQNVTNPINQGQASGLVFDYNFSTNSFYTQSPAFAQGAYASHNAGNEMNLYEGNDLIFGPWVDCEWGGMAQLTVFRSAVPAFQPGKTGTTIPLITRCHDREINYVGNVLGTTGYHNQYQAIATSNSGGTGVANEFTSIYSLGFVGTGGGCTGNIANMCDTLSVTSLMRWGNYDVFNNAVQWNSTEASPPAAFGVNANFTSSYFSTLAHTLPNSLYYTSQPSWWLSGVAWPPIGPDITTGNVKKCSGGTFNQVPALTAAQCTGGGTLVTDWGSHVNAIPALVCYLVTMGGPPDGSGAVLPFDSGTCYSSAAGSPVGTLSPTRLTFASQVVGTSSQPQSFTFTNTGTAALVISTITLTGDYSQTNNCPFSTPGLGIGQSCTFNVIFIPTAAGTRNGTITITSNASNNPSIEQLQGTGVTTLTIENGTIIINGVTIQN